MPRAIETLFVPGPAGRLEALLEEPEEQEPTFAALVCHPHPQHGGTMHNKVVYRLARGLRKAGGVVLRFNYRGVNLSEGSYDDGNGETEDARAALRLLRSRYPNLPYVLAGFSFGSRIVLRLGTQLPETAKVIAVGFPVGKQFDMGALEPCTVPRHFLHATNDAFGSVAQLTELVAKLSGPPKLDFIPAKDHFFVDALDAFEQAVIAAAPTL